jgi:hypothetical protein
MLRPKSNSASIRVVVMRCALGWETRRRTEACSISPKVRDRPRPPFAAMSCSLLRQSDLSQHAFPYQR